MPSQNRPGAAHASRLPLLLPILLIQTACIGTATTTVYRHPQQAVIRAIPEPGTKAEPHEAPTAPAPQSEASAPEDRTAGGGTRASAATPAVLALMNEAEANLASGDLDNAATNLERAIRIQPKNPKLWHELADIRLKQQQPGLAEDLAKKSNLHAKGDDALIQANWTIIAEARRLKGDTTGAAEALRKAGQ